MLFIALLSILIAYGSGDLLITILSVIVMMAIGNMFGIVPLWLIVIYGIIASAIAYTKGNAHA